MKRIALLAGTVLVLHGCSYAISRDTAGQADKTITFSQILQAPESAAGKLVILGGTIAAIKNTKQGTLLEVEEKPLDLWGKPKRTGATGGLFLLTVARFLDPVVYAPGREITVAAEVKGTFETSFARNGVTLPLLQSRELKLWEQERPSGRPGFWDPLYDPHGPVRRE